MRLLRSDFDVDTRFGGRFVQSIDGLKGAGAARPARLVLLRERRGVREGAAEYELSPGDRVQWDYRPGGRRRCRRSWAPSPSRSSRARGQAPPRAPGVRRPGLRACRDAKDALERRRGARVGRPLGAPGTETSCGWWWPPGPGRGSCAGRRARGGARGHGVFARFSDEASSSCSTSAARGAHRPPGDGTALVVALRPRADELVWLVTGLDEDALLAGARALRESACATRSRWP